MVAALVALAPLSAHAFIPFGGRITSVVACATPPGAFLTTVVGVRPIVYLWQPGIPYFRQGPPTPGQSVIGVVAPAPVPCLGFGLGPPLGAGFPILFLLHGSSAI